MNVLYIVIIVGGSGIVLWTIFSIAYLTLATTNFKKKTAKMTWKQWFRASFLDNFAQKKILYLIALATFNIAISTIAFIFASQRAIFITLICLKSKDIIMAIVQVIHSIYFIIKVKILRKQPKPIKIEKSNIISLIPIYSEPKDQIDVTTKSIIANKIGDHENLICMVCDGIDVNVEDDLTEVLYSAHEPYYSWKFEENTLHITYGKIDKTPCIIIKKQKNMGKKDTLILGHDLFNQPRTNLNGMNKILRDVVRRNILQFYGMDTFEYIFCTDADSDISDESFVDLIETIERNNAVAACGLVVIDFNGHNWKFWNLFQNFQYLYGQYIRRATENLYGKVSCLPGCITMFKVSEVASKAICMYSTLPEEHEMLKSIVQLLGTDRRLTASFLYQGKDVITKYDPRAKCLTIPPDKLKAYVSQRRRWGSNALFNTMCNVIAPNIHPFMRFFGILDIIRMSLAYFRVFNTILFVFSLKDGVDPRDLAPFLTIMMFPTTYFMFQALFSGFLRKMYHKLLIGYVFNKLFSIVLTIMVLSNVFWNVGSVKWGGNQKEVVQEEKIEVVIEGEDKASEKLAKEILDDMLNCMFR